MNCVMDGPILTWRKKSDDGYGCEYLLLGSIRVAGYSHSISSKTDYDLYIDLPGVKEKNLRGQSIPELKERACAIVSRWVEVSQKNPNGKKE